MDTEKRNALTKEISSFIKHTDINSRHHDHERAQKELSDITSQDYTGIKGAEPILKPLTSTFKNGTSDVIMYANRLIMLVEPLVTMDMVNHVLDQIKKDLTPDNTVKSLNALKSAFYNQEWFGWVDNTLEENDIQSGESWPWVLRQAVHGNMKPAEYAKLYARMKRSYPYYKVSIDDPDKVTSPVEKEDVEGVINEMKLFEVGNVNEYQDIRKDYANGQEN